LRRLIETTGPGALDEITDIGRERLEYIATGFELISEAENLLTRRATMFAARFASSYNQLFPDKHEKSATINREIEL
jgi:hypothetical protein